MGNKRARNSVSGGRQSLADVRLLTIAGEAIMTDDQVNLVVKHLCEQLHLALRLKNSAAHPPNAKEIGFDPASVSSVLLTGLRSAGVTIHHEAAGTSEEPPWS
jgi:hypothetical protein